jgi:hypothetical protein
VIVDVGDLETGADRALHLRVELALHSRQVVLARQELSRRGKEIADRVDERRHAGLAENGPHR